MHISNIYKDEELKMINKIIDILENNKARLTDVNAAVSRNDKLFDIYNNNSKVYLIKPDKDIEVKKKNIIEVVENILHI